MCIRIARRSAAVQCDASRLSFGKLLASSETSFGLQHAPHFGALSHLHCTCTFGISHTEWYEVQAAQLPLVFPTTYTTHSLTLTLTCYCPLCHHHIEPWWTIPSATVAQRTRTVYCITSYFNHFCACQQSTTVIVHFSFILFIISYIPSHYPVFPAPHHIICQTSRLDSSDGAKVPYVNEFRAFSVHRVILILVVSIWLVLVCPTFRHFAVEIVFSVDFGANGRVSRFDRLCCFRMFVPDQRVVSAHSRAG